MRALRSSCGWLLAAAALSQAQPDVASIEGSVTHSMTGAPIPRAHIALRGAGPNAKNYGALASADGKFTIAGIAPGKYEAWAERVGFFTPAGPGARTAIELVLAAGDKKESLKFRLAPLGSVSGRVVDAEGEPVEAASVSIETGPGYSSIHDTTDDKGRFRLDALSPGRYRVRAELPSNLPAPPEIRTDGTVEVRYVPTYYGGVTDYKSAVRVEVGTGAEVDGIEIRMARAPMVRISGKVVGLPAEQRGVELAFARTTGAKRLPGLKKDGLFEVWNVDPGKYFLTASWYTGNQRVQTAPVNIEVGLSNIEHVELRTVPPSDLAGQIAFDDDGARPPQGNGRPPRLELRTVDPGMSIDPAISDVAPDGSFHLTGVKAARFRAMLSWNTAYVKTVTLGSNPVEGNVLNLRNGSAGEPLTVLLSSAFGSISGTVSDADGPVPGARIALVRDDFVSLGDVTFANADSTGAYSIANVRPGKYRIAVVEEGDNGPHAGNLDDYEEFLSHIEVQPKDKLTKDLRRRPPVR